MRYTTLKEQYTWEPVCFEIKDILLLLQNAVMAEFVALVGGQYHWIGVACEYDRAKQLFGEQIYYIDDQEFASLEDLIFKATLGEWKFIEVHEPLNVIDSLEGDPAFYLDLLTELKTDIGKGSEILS